jgi:hypothetical protein
MGNTVSNSIGFGGRITRQQLLDSTRDNREFTNKIFKIMIDKITPLDILELSDSGKCSKYVFLMAQSIGKIFDDLRIMPKKDAVTGVVYYQKIDELIKPKNEGDKRKTRELCLIIAYFNIRLFQIFGALTLSIVDDVSSGAVLGSLYSNPLRNKMYTFEQKEPSGERGFWGQAQARPGAKPTLIGGSVDESFFTGIAKTKFKIFKDILDGPIELDIYSDRKTKEVCKFQDSDIYLFFDNRTTNNLYYRNDNNSFFCIINVTLYQPMTHGAYPPVYGAYQPYGAYPQQQLGPRALSDTFTRIKVTLQNYKFINKDFEEKTLIEINKRISRLSSEFTIVTDFNDWRVDDASNTQFITKLKSEFYKKILIELKKIIPNINISRRDDDKDYERSSSDYIFTESSSSDKVLRTKYIIDAIKQVTSGNTTSFCVARALQLIDARSVLVPKPTVITSSVCKSSPTGLSKSIPNTKITDVPGIQALDQLYYKRQLKEDGKRDFIPDESYIKFLDDMRKAFNTKAPTTLKGLDSIPAKSLDDCAREAINHYLFIKDPKKISEIMSYVNTLFKIQLDHTKNVINFFKNKLFTIKKTDKGTVVDIHPALLTGDLNQLENVSKEARNLLVSYYTNCENKYQDGLKAALDGKKYNISVTS